MLEFSVDGRDAMFLDEQEKNWQPDKPGPITAGRFDYGPELTVIPHPKIWSGEWTGEITGAFSAKLTSPREEAAGMQLVREFSLVERNKSVRLSCQQTMINISKEVREVCHWGRSFSPGGGICLIPLGDRPSRFPSKYAMYEDSAIINVRNTDEKIRERDGFLEILSPPQAEARLRFAGRLAGVSHAEQHTVRETLHDVSRPHLQRGGRTHAVGVVSNRPAHRTRTDRPARTTDAGRVSRIHRGLVVAEVSVSEGRRADRSERTQRASRATDNELTWRSRPMSRGPVLKNKLGEVEIFPAGSAHCTVKFSFVTAVFLPS